MVVEQQPVIIRAATNVATSEKGFRGIRISVLFGLITKRPAGASGSAAKRSHYDLGRQSVKAHELAIL